MFTRTFPRLENVFPIIPSDVNASTLAWERLGIPPSELVNGEPREREVWGPLLELHPRDPTPDQRLEDENQNPKESGPE